MSKKNTGRESGPLLLLLSISSRDRERGRDLICISMSGAGGASGVERKVKVNQVVGERIGKSERRERPEGFLFYSRFLSIFIFIFLSGVLKKKHFDTT